MPINKIFSIDNNNEKKVNKIINGKYYYWEKKKLSENLKNKILKYWIKKNKMNLNLVGTQLGYFDSIDNDYGYKCNKNDQY